MAYTSSRSSSSSDNEVYDDSFCSKSCRKNTENLNNKIIKLNEELSDCETDLYNYKRGLSQVEARLVEFKNNEIKFCERIRVLERDIELKDNKIENLRNELEELKKEKDSIDDKTGLPEFIDDTVTDYSRPTPSIDVPRDVSESVSFFEQRGSVGHKGLGEIKGTRIIRIPTAGSDFVITRKPAMGGKMLKLMKITLVQMDAQTQGRHEHDQEFDAEITTVGAEVDDIAAET
ncbi:hypothetical protein Tco_0973255 [Tanacetum coccineum]